MTEAFPILEILDLTTHRDPTIPMDHSKAILSAFRFPHLTFLSLRNFQLVDGAALLTVKLEAVLMFKLISLNHYLSSIRSPFSVRSYRSFILKRITWIRHLSHPTWNVSSVRLTIYVISGIIHTYFFHCIGILRS